MSEHPISILARRYPALYLPVTAGMKDSEQYKNVVLRGQQMEGRPSFSYDDKDSLASFVTPAGTVDVLVLHERADFIHAIQSLAYRCEPRPVPDSMGASSLSGLINWEKIRAHLDAYRLAGGIDENREFARFTADKRNYLDCLIILSSGAYSAVSADAVGLPEKLWLQKSIEIRKFHELTHFYSQHRYPKNKEAIRDEVLADLIGILAAFGEYNPGMARCFLGIENRVYREGGRLQNYCSAGELSAVISRVNTLIDTFSSVLRENHGEDVFSVLDYFEQNKIGIE